MNSGARRILAACVASVLLAGFAPRARAAMSSLDSLVAAERAFAAMSVEHGMRDAFLTYLAPEGVVFAPDATNGMEAWKSRPTSNATLRWAPEMAEISGAGDLGWTTGPWEYQPAGDAHATACGHFVSVWRRQADGTFKLAADLGISHPPQSSVTVDNVQFRPGPAHEPAEWGKTHGVHAASFDHELAERSRRTSISMAFSSIATDKVRLNLQGDTPRVGRLEAIGALDSLDGAWHFLLEGSGSARSGDLAYTYGEVQRFLHGAKTPADTCAYLHIWRRDIGNRWELAVAVHKPLR